MRDLSKVFEIKKLKLKKIITTTKKKVTSNN